MLGHILSYLWKRHCLLSGLARWDSICGRHFDLLYVPPRESIQEALWELASSKGEADESAHGTFHLLDYFRYRWESNEPFAARS